MDRTNSIRENLSLDELEAEFERERNAFYAHNAANMQLNATPEMIAAVASSFGMYDDLPEPAQVLIDQQRTVDMMNRLEDDKPTFERHADATLEAVRATYADRGITYGDSWDGRPGQPVIFTRLALNAVLERTNCLHDLVIDDLLLIQSGAIVDLKDSRLASGGYHEDSIIDGIAYRARFLGGLKEYRAKHHLDGPVEEAR